MSRSHVKSRVLVVALGLIVLLLRAGGVDGAVRPRHGGTLRVEMRARVSSLDPRVWPADNAAAASAEKLAGLVFERLVAMDDLGRPQPQLAVAWHHAADYKRWEFTLRTGVKFHDGSRLSSRDVASVLQAALGAERQITDNGEIVVIQSVTAMPDLLDELAGGRYFIFRAQTDGSLSGTGPFRVAIWPTAIANPTTNRANLGNAKAERTARAESVLPRAIFAANQEYWNGAPFVDRVEVTMGVAPQRQFQDLQFASADVIELTSEQVRRATQTGLRTWSSAPVELFAVVFDRETSTDARLRQALSLSIDRAAITNVLLQKLGEPAGGLLPEWLGGYAFLFATGADPERAQQLRNSVRGASGTASKPIIIGVESDDDSAQLIAERIALNARQAGIVIQVNGRGQADARLVTRRLDSVAASAALAQLVYAIDPSDESAATLKKIGSSEPEQTYAAERAILENARVIPIVYLPETAGIGPAVRDWMPRRWGEWRLEEIWLDRPAVGTQSSSGTGSEGRTGARP